MADQVLNLSTTEFDRPVVVIDGESYEMRSPDELSVQMQLQIERIVESLESEDDERSIEAGDKSLSEQVSIVMVDLPDEMLSALGPIQKARILQVFTKLVNEAIGSMTGDDQDQRSSQRQSSNATSAAN